MDVPSSFNNYVFVVRTAMLNNPGAEVTQRYPANE